MQKKNTIYKICTVGVFGALVFVSNFISIPIPVAVGDLTRIHLANGVCLLSGLILGPVGGGFAAGIGSALFDVMTPAYVASAPFTLLFKFLLACIPGLFMKYGKGKISMNILGCALGQIAYIALYLGKSYITGLLEGSAPGALIPAMLTKLGTSSANAIIAIVISVALYSVLKAALKKSKLAFTEY
ncbi:MAG: ECF transporter S component [Oscillospiraceae bacterium]